MNLQTFFIESLIVHDVPRGTTGATGESVVLSEAVSELDDELRNLFKERMVKSLLNQRIDVVEDEDESSPVPGLIRTVLSDESQLVEASQNIAVHLHTCQNAVNPEGLLIVCTGTTDGEQCLGVMKLEREDAVRIQPTDENGNRTFSIDHLRDLMMGKNTKVFKASLFENPLQGQSLTGILSDPQRGSKSNSEISDFFLRRFLGCTLPAQPNVLTRQFYEGTNDWINSLADDEKKAKYELALIAELNSPGTSLRVRDFATGSLETEDRAAYRSHMSEFGVPVGQFDKDLDLIENRVKKMTMTMSESKIKVTGTPDAIEEYSQVVGGEDGQDPHLRINDTLNEVRGGG